MNRWITRLGFLFIAAAFLRLAPGGPAAMELPLGMGQPALRLATPAICVPSGCGLIEALASLETVLSQK